jgi:hypothetical protein
MRSKRKSLTVNQQRAKDKHDKWLRKRGVHPDQIRAILPYNAKGKRLGVGPMPDYKSHQGERTIKTSDIVKGSTSLRQSNTYTGDFIVGVATMHKSNLVPVNRNQDGSDYATMRRN